MKFPAFQANIPESLVIRLASVDFPPPEGPTNATVCPAAISIETPQMTSVSVI